MSRTVYVLKLNGGKYYVGSTQRTAIERITEHVNGRQGSGYTKEYGVVDIFNIIPNASIFEETFTTIKMMHEFGINNVRGGPFCELHLSLEKKQMLDLLFLNFNDQRTLCGSSSHFVKECPKNTLGNKCYKCAEYGHFPKECRNKVVTNLVKSENDCKKISTDVMSVMSVKDLLPEDVMSVKDLLPEDVMSVKELSEDEINEDDLSVQELSKYDLFEDKLPEIINEKITGVTNCEKDIDVCLNCKEAGHYAKQCTRPIRCNKCDKTGHKSYECKNVV